MSGRHFFDTNVLVYLFDEDEPAKQRRAREVLAERQDQVVLSTQVLKELFATLTRRLRKPQQPEMALATLRRFARFPVVGLSPDLIIEGAELSVHHQISLWDALILTAARSAGCERVVTEDLQDGWNVLGLTIENPFADL